MTEKCAGDFMNGVLKEAHAEDVKQPSREPCGFGAAYSFNNRLMVEPYKTDKSLKAVEKNGFAMISQKVVVKGLRLMVEARLNDGKETSTVLRKGSIVYIREELLHTQPWATKVLSSEAVDGPFIIVDISNVEFVQPA